MTRIFCDRCGVEMDFQGAHDVDVDRYVRGWERFHLCTSCRDAVLDFIRKPAATAAIVQLPVPPRGPWWRFWGKR